MSDTSDKKTSAFRFIKPLLNIHIDDPSAYLLLTFLCQVANNMTGASWHGYASITYTTGLSQKTIQRATKTLVQLGVISCTLRGREETKLYTVHHHKLLELAEQGKAGRDKFILAQREQDAVRQQRCRSRQKTLVSVTTTATKEVETNPVAVKSACCSGQIGTLSRSNQPLCSGHSDRGTY